jgi:hypothetical protein
MFDNWLSEALQITFNYLFYFKNQNKLDLKLDIQRLDIQYDLILGQKCRPKIKSKINQTF